MHKRRHHVSLSLSHTPHASLHPHRQSSRSSYMFVRWARRVRARRALERTRAHFTTVSRYSHTDPMPCIECIQILRTSFAAQYVLFVFGMFTYRAHTTPYTQRERETERTHESTYSILTSVSSSSAVTSSIHNHTLLSLFTPTPPHTPTPIIHTHTLIHRHCESTHHPSCRVGLASVESISSISYRIDGF